MRRAILFMAILVGLAAPLHAQFGKQVHIRAGTAEDKALQEISNATDPAAKLALIDKFLAEFGQGEIATVAYDLYVTYYLGEKDYDKAFEYGDKLLAIDPDNFQACITLIRAAQERGAPVKMMEYGERVSAILARYKALPPPEGTDPESWQTIKAQTLANIQDNLTYIHHALFAGASLARDPGTKANLFELYANLFPDSPFALNAVTMAADSYRQARDFPKMLSFAQSVLSRDPNNIGILLLLADHWTEGREQLNQAEAYATKVLSLLEKAEKPEHVTDEQWQQQTALQKGLALSTIGQIHIHLNRDVLAIDVLKAANPLLKPYAFYYGRNLYLLGFALARAKRTAEARTVLTEAVSVDSPYKTLAQETLDKITRRRP